MNLYEQIEQWTNNKTLIELHTVSKGNRRRRAHGRIYSFDPVASKMLFYNDDTKSVENVLLSEIENVFCSESASEEKREANVEETTSGTPSPKPLPDSANKRVRLLNEMKTLLNELSEEDLETLLPLIKRLSQDKKGSFYAG